MKKYVFAALLLSGISAFVGTSAVSCTAVATSRLGLAIIKKILLGGIARGFNTFNDKSAFLKSEMIESALPSQLREINSLLQRISPNLVAKEKDYIAQAASYTVNVSRPILDQAVNNLTADDVSRIMDGTTATQVLKEKASAQLVQAIMPKVDEQLNQFGLVKSINLALQGNSLLSGVFGNNSSAPATGSISRLASQQIVDGLFNIIAQYEQENKAQIMGAINK